MDTIKISLYIVVPLVLVYGVLKLVLQRKAIGVLSKIGKENILLISSSANFFGQESAGLMQIRGNGVLALTKDKLYFELLLPNKIIEIPLDNIEEIDECRSYLGKTVGSKLLKVIFRNGSDSMDSCAWLVRNHNEWMGKLEQLG